MTSLQLKTIAATLAIAIATASAQTQSTPDATPATTSELPSWLTEASLGKESTLQVVTLKEPTVRHTCHVQAIEKERVLCTHKFGAKPTVYNREDIAALIEHTPGDHPWLTFAALFGAGSGIMTGACFLASVTVVGAVPVALVGTVVLLVSWMAFLDDNPPHDSLLYLKPGTTLAIKLHELANTSSATPTVSAASSPAAS